MLKRLVSLLLLTITCLSTIPLQAEIDISEKMYIDEDEFKTSGELGDAFHIHIGNNVWLCTNTVHRDKTGLFTYECNIARSMKGLGKGYQMNYEKKWKCPYCYSYWPIGTTCQNKDCPSKYKG